MQKCSGWLAYANALFVTAVLAFSGSVAHSQQLCSGELEQFTTGGLTRLERTRDAADLAEEVYTARPIGHKTPDGWSVAGARSGTAGFFGAAYKHPSRNEVVIAFRGTDDLFLDSPTYRGITSGETVPEGGEPFLQTPWGSQLRQAKEFTAFIRAQYPGAAISFTGHSLGGALAQVEAARTGWTADTFNAPGVESTVQRLYPDGQRFSDNVRNHVRGTDLVSQVGSHFGTVMKYAGVEGG